MQEYCLVVESLVHILKVLSTEPLMIVASVSGTNFTVLTVSTCPVRISSTPLVVFSSACDRVSLSGYL